MALFDSCEKSGNYLFRHRGEIPIVLFAFAIPVIYYTPAQQFSVLTREIFTYAAILLSFLGFLIRAIAIATTPKGTSGRNTKSGQVAESLNTKGIYSIVRHPLYLGNYFMWIGIVLFTYNWVYVVIVSLLFWLYYERIMFAEESYLEKKFGEEYMQWAKRVPAFIPRFKKYEYNPMPFSFKSVLIREYPGVLATVVGFVYVNDLRIYFQNGSFRLETTGHYLLLATFIIALALRTLKHNNTLLQKEGRS